MQLKVKKLHKDAVLPRYASAGAACFDLHAIGSVQLELNNSRTQRFRTGLSFEIPKGWVMLIFSRSGHGFKFDTRLANCVGVIDADYRGEVMVKLTFDGDMDGSDEVNPVPFFGQNDRIAQAMLVQIPQVELVEVDELSDTVRGSGGFGSTGS